MPHSTVSTRDDQGRRTCPYCGYPLRGAQALSEGVCPAHRDLLRLEPLDDRVTLADDGEAGS